MRKLLYLIFFVWVVLWALFGARELFIKGTIADYKALVAASLEEKRAYVTGKELYEFIDFCNRALPAGAAYSLVGMKEDSIDKRRAAYYLYPHIESKDSVYLLVFNAPAKVANGYRMFAKLDDTRYILALEGADKGL
jgi:hypothetical protein